MKKIVTSLLLILLLASCDGGSCIDADDFGYPTIPVEVSGGNRGTLAKYPQNPELSWIQKVWATSTGYVLSGDSALKVTFNGAWSPWDAFDGLDTDGYDYDDATGEMVPDNSNWCDLSTFSEFVDPGTGEPGLENDNLSTSETPCFLIEGLGLYIGFSRNQDTDLLNNYHYVSPEYFSQDSNGWYFTMPLSKLTEIKDVLGVARFTSIKVYIMLLHYNYDSTTVGCLAQDIDGNTIFDTGDTDFAVYECNLSPSITFLSGVRSEDSGFLQSIVNYIVDPFERMVEGLYKSLVGNDFIGSLVNLLAALFISYMGITYVLGLTHFTSKELMHLLFKFGIIYTFLSPENGWIFYQYFVTFFWEGSQELAYFVADSINKGASTAGSSISISNMSVTSAIMMPLDNIIESFSSNAVQRKMLSMVFSHPIGFLFYLVMMFVMFVFIFAAIEVTVVVVTVYIIMAIMLALGPIFFIMLMLPYSRKYFDNWLKILLGTMLQPMLLLTFINFFSQVIYDYMQRLLYFRACFHTIIALPFLDIGFWKVARNGVQVYDEDTASYIDGTLDQVLSFPSLFILMTFSLFMKYMVEKVPDITDQLAGGMSFSQMTANTRKMVQTARGAAESVAGGAAMHFVGKPLRNLGVTIAGKTAFATLVKGTEAYDLRKAQSDVRKDYIAKGFNDKEIQQMMTAPKGPGSAKDVVGNDEVEKRFKQRRAASSLKYGTGKILSFKSIPGVNGLMRMKNDGISGNFQRVVKAASDHYARGSAKSSGNYSNWKNNRAAQKRKAGSAYKYNQMQQFSPAYRKAFENRDSNLHNGNVVADAMEQKVKGDVAAVTEKYNARGMGGMTINSLTEYNKKKSPFMSQGEAREKADEQLEQMRKDISSDLQAKGYSKETADELANNEISDALAVEEAKKEEEIAKAIKKKMAADKALTKEKARKKAEEEREKAQEIRLQKEEDLQKRQKEIREVELQKGTAFSRGTDHAARDIAANLTRNGEVLPSDFAKNLSSALAKEAQIREDLVKARKSGFKAQDKDKFGNINAGQRGDVSSAMGKRDHGDSAARLETELNKHLRDNKSTYELAAKASFKVSQGDIRGVQHNEANKVRRSADRAKENEDIIIISRGKNGKLNYSNAYGEEEKDEKKKQAAAKAITNIETGEVNLKNGQSWGMKYKK